MASIRLLALLASFVSITFGSPTGSWNPDWNYGDHKGGQGRQLVYYGDGLTVDLGYAKYKGIGLIIQPASNNFWACVMQLRLLDPVTATKRTSAPRTYQINFAWD